MARCRYPLGHFPFPVQIFPTPPPGRPGVPLAVAVRWYWRVRSWNVTLTTHASFHYASSTESAEITMAGASVSGTFGRPLGTYIGPGYVDLLDSEANLVVPLGLGRYESTANGGGAYVYTYEPPLDYPTPPTPVNGDLEAYLFGLNFGVGLRGYLVAIGMVYCPATDLYYPDFYLYASINSVSDYGDQQLNFYFGPALQHPIDYVQPPTFGVPVLCTIEGYPFTMNGEGLFQADLPRDQGGNALPWHFSGCSATLSMTPNRFWTYQDWLGHPLYDEETGDPAINPVTNAPYTDAEIVGASWP